MPAIHKKSGYLTNAQAAQIVESGGAYIDDSTGYGAKVIPIAFGLIFILFALLK